MEFLKGLGITLLVIIVLLGLGWAVEGNNFFMYKYFAPKEEGVRREVFENTKSFQVGTIQTLDQYHSSWVTADSNGKKTIEPMAVREASNMDMQKLPPDLYQWVMEIRRNQGVR